MAYNRPRWEKSRGILRTIGRLYYPPNLNGTKEATMKRLYHLVYLCSIMGIYLQSATANLLPVDSIPGPISGTSHAHFDIPKDRLRVYDLSFTLSNLGTDPIAPFDIRWLNTSVFAIGGSSGPADPFGPTPIEITLFSPPSLDVGTSKPLDFLLTPQFAITNLTLEAVPEAFPTSWLLLPLVLLFLARRSGSHNP
jgi:hypothetical protein